MQDNIIEFLNSHYDAGDALISSIIALAAWSILWRLIFQRLLRRCNVTSFWYELYELGALGTFCILIFLLIIAVLFVASLQAVLCYGTNLLFPLIIFWGGITTIAILIIRYIRKDKGR